MLGVQPTSSSTKSRRDFLRSRRLECDNQPHDKRWRIVNDLLHCHVTDKTRIDDENKHLCRTFADFFVSNQLKLAISDKITLLIRIPNFHDPPHSGLPLNQLPAVTNAEVLKILNSSPAKSSPADYVPPSLIKACPGIFDELIAKLANLSSFEGCFPTSFKHAVVTPLLKKPSLDKSVPGNYRPISNLNFISKVLERLFLTRIQSHIFNSPKFNQYQSVYRRLFSTKRLLYLQLTTFFSFPTVVRLPFSYL